MTHPEFNAILARVGGVQGHALAAMHGVSYGLALRWINGKSPIPEPVANWWRYMGRCAEITPPPRAW